jgi:hypothetical protein
VRLMYSMTVWGEPMLALLLLLWAGGSIWILANGRQVGRYLLPWSWASAHEGTRLLLVRLAATLNFVAAVRMLLKTTR